MFEGKVLGYSYGEVVMHRLAKKTLEDFDWSENRILALVVSKMVAMDIWSKGLGLVGWTGVGKTHVLISLYKERMWRAIYKNGQIPAWFSFQDLCSLYYKDRDGFRDVLLGGIIFVDDLFCKDQSEEEMRVVKELVYYIYDLGKVLCFTSNVLMDMLDIDERVKSRLSELVEVVEVFGEDRRKLL
uniref:IstB-like ATP-binding protein domain-containing protein n=1 Tax=candidate division CPR3 bacterium TaxID=2268181 RepID=A0A7V3N580_UNCC3